MRIFEYAKVADWESRLQTLATMARTGAMELQICTKLISISRA